MKAETDTTTLGICATALMSVIERTGELPLAKALLVMPLVMHDATLSFLSNASVRKREAAALTSVRCCQTVLRGQHCTRDFQHLTRSSFRIEQRAIPDCSHHPLLV
ncbi:hypothetical protein [Paraburkholderia sp. MM5482-R1]|uniref:hypothetical protein n=1 Tax=unclassified Paraburkholderia TaxID=2615204 RepID=UPI003D21FAF1